MKLKALVIEKKITHLPAELCAPFIQWMLNGGHEPNRKKDCVTLKRGSNVAKIFCTGRVEPSYKMNDYCITRFEMFLQQWIKQDRRFTDSLRSQAEKTVTAAQRELGISYLRIAA